ncbi:cold-shock protein [Streptomyces zaomyceticus]|uniref:cold-shock protein n=1 Tax=Streptomyces zaomyceticus TaxID=68286 RepID=UPI00341C3B1A
MATGTVKRFNAEKGFGFIQQDEGGPDVVVHLSSLPGSKELAEGTPVEYDVTLGPTGPQAQNVMPLR